MSYGDRPTTDVFAEYEIFLQPISINHSESHLSPFQLFSLFLSLFHSFSCSLRPFRIRLHLLDLIEIRAKKRKKKEEEEEEKWKNVR